MPLLQTEGVTKRFGGLVAVNRVSLRIEEGEILGLVGPNGAGKTVLLNCIAGAFAPDTGRIVFDGTDIAGWSADRVCHLGIGRTFQIPRLFPKLSALENVLVAAVFGHRGEGGQDPKAWARTCLERVEFSGDEAARAQTLNTAELKRLDLARALASRPKLLLLDELAAGLMTGHLRELIGVLRRIHAMGVTILLIEHVMRTVADLCHRTMVLHYGEKIADAPTPEVLKNPQVVEAYLGQAYAG